MEDWMYLKSCGKLKSTGMLAYKLYDDKRTNPFVVQFLGRSLSPDILGIKPDLISYLIGWCWSPVKVGGRSLGFLKY